MKSAKKQKQQVIFKTQKNDSKMTAQNLANQFSSN